MVAKAVDERDVVETLDAVESLFDVRLAADAEMFELAARFADLSSGGSIPVGGRTLPGVERAVRVGGVSTPSIAEFCVAEFGARMRMGSWAARRYLADALDTRHRLRLCWGRVRSGVARVQFVRLVAAKTRHLSPQAAACVDAAMAEFLDGCLPWGRFESRLDGKVIAADPETAAAREAARAGDQFAKRTRGSESGTAGFYIRSTVGVIARFDASVSFLAEALRSFGDTEDLDRRRVKAVVVLSNPARAVELLAAFAAQHARTADTVLPLEDQPTDKANGSRSAHRNGADGERDGGGPEAPAEHDALDRMDAFARRVGFTPTRLPVWLRAREVGAADRPCFTFDWSRLLPTLTLNLHMSRADLAGGEVAGRGGVVRWEGEGPVTHQFVHDHLRPLHRYLIQPVIDLANMAPVDAYEIPDRHRQAVHLRTPADCSPFSSSTSRKVDIDHTDKYDAAPEDAQEKDFKSRLDNYGPLGRFNHRLKTHGHWTVKQPFGGIYLWRDPHGHVYLVDHTGTHKVTVPATSAGAVSRFDPGIELHPSDLVIEIDFHHAS